MKIAPTENETQRLQYSDIMSNASIPIYQFYLLHHGMNLVKHNYTPATDSSFDAEWQATVHINPWDYTPEGLVWPTLRCLFSFR